MEQNTEKSLENVKFSEVFANLSKDQLRFVVAMQEYNSKKEAAKELKIKIGCADHVAMRIKRLLHNGRSCKFSIS